MDLSGQGVIVTGAADGVGLASALAFARRGAGIVLVDISEEALRAAESVFAGEGLTVVALSGDAASPETVAEAVRVCGNRFGSLDHVHANAGIGTPGLAVDISDDAWSRVLEVNLSGAFRLARAKLATLAPGTITFTSSPHGLATTSGAAAYAASKSALLGLTRALALEGAPHGIRCNSVVPGAIDTPMVRSDAASYADPAARLAEYAAQHPLNRLGQPAEIAHAVLFLVEAQFVTGSSLVVDGGLLARMGTTVGYS